MYKVKAIKECDLEKYTGKIIQVIERRKYDIPTYDPVTGTRPWYEWGEGYELVCLVEENK